MPGIGYAAEIIERRERILAHCSPAVRARITGRHAPVIPVHHEIVVDLRTGVRSVKTRDPLDELPKINKIERVVKKVHIQDRPFTRHCRRPVNTRVSVFQVLAAVCVAYGVTIAGLIGPARYRRVAWPRHAAAKLLRDERNMSLPNVGYVLGRRDHTTIMVAIRRADDFMVTQPDWARRFQHAKDLLA